MDRKQIIGSIAAIFLFPVVVTFLVTGQMGNIKSDAISSGKIIVCDSGKVDVEEYIIGVLAEQMDITYEMESLKSQAVIIRTYIYKMMQGENKISESDLSLTRMSTLKMENLWGDDDFETNYKKLVAAVKETLGVIITYNGNLIDSLFHFASAGATRTADNAMYPYLVSKVSNADESMPNFIAAKNWDENKFVESINTISPKRQIATGDVLSSIQILSKDDMGYVDSMQIAGQVFSGEEVQLALQTPSTCMTFENYEGRIRVTSKGVGHGFGMSQWGANEMAKSGSTYDQILTYYYTGVQVYKE